MAVLGVLFGQRGSKHATEFRRFSKAPNTSFCFINSVRFDFKNRFVSLSLIFGTTLYNRIYTHKSALKMHVNSLSIFVLLFNFFFLNVGCLQNPFSLFHLVRYRNLCCELWMIQQKTFGESSKYMKMPLLTLQVLVSSLVGGFACLGDVTRSLQQPRINMEFVYTPSRCKPLVLASSNFKTRAPCSGA